MLGALAFSSELDVRTVMPGRDLRFPYSVCMGEGSGAPPRLVVYGRGSCGGHR